MREDQEHLASCMGLADFRTGKDKLVTIVLNGVARKKEKGWD